MSKSLNLNLHSVSPDLGSNCLQRLSEDNKKSKRDDFLRNKKLAKFRTTLMNLNLLNDKSAKAALTLCLLVSSADNLCKQFGPRSCLT